MLVLSRKKNQTIRINDDVTVVLIDIRGDKCRLGVIAPTSMPVHRGEVYDAIQRQNLAARLEAAKTEIGESEIPPLVDGRIQPEPTDGLQGGGA